ncbi:hypothetical protein C2G38_2231209 [Gigaspora rosea]|uniref:Protein kinase domain-containing protein n=1 Tax=Gigaspora rosea TaxID=44941 RepID=A0A397TT53_9GLOM|nr:hypothetical protein C2G38_2231209 [Gigaspora rosea]
MFGVLKDKVSKDLRKNLHVIVQKNWEEKLNLLQSMVKLKKHLKNSSNRFFITIPISCMDCLCITKSSDISPSFAYITDLGLSIMANIASKSNSNGIYGILPYIAPEILNKYPYTKESNIYSIGIII